MTKRKTFKRLVAGMLAALLCVLGIIPGLGTGAEQAEAADVDLHSKTYNAGGKKLKDYWGATNQDVLSWLGKHINDNYYLGTPYANYHSESNSNTGGSDWRSPTGDVAERDGFPGNDDKAGQAMMNCTGSEFQVASSAFRSAQSSFQRVSSNLNALNYTDQEEEGSGWIDPGRFLSGKELKKWESLPEQKRRRYIEAAAREVGRMHLPSARRQKDHRPV